MLGRNRRYYGRRGYRRFKFRPRPPIPRPKIKTVEGYARFYGLYENKKGEVKRFSFQVKVGKRYSNKLLHRLIVVTCNLILARQLPEHKKGQVFRSFHELIGRTRWFRVRKLLEYKAGMEYER